MGARRHPSSHAAAGISVDAIAAAGLAVIRRDGVRGLTMGAVAELLDVRAPSLYHHVRGKAELLELVAANAFAAFDDDREAYERVADLDEWIALTTAGSLRLYEFYAGHPGLAHLIQTTAGDRGSGNRAALVEAQIDALRRIGVPGQVARELFETSARWTLAAIAAEAPDKPGEPGEPGEPGRNREMFARGLELMMRGIRSEVETRARSGR